MNLGIGSYNSGNGYMVSDGTIYCPTTTEGVEYSGCFDINILLLKSI